MAQTAAEALALSGCGGDTGAGSGGGSGEEGVALTLAKPNGAITTESHNSYLADSSASKYG